jgi:adenylate cyclase
MSQGEPLAGQQEVEQTLRLARDEVERDIARYRLGLFSAVVVVTAINHYASRTENWLPTSFFVAAVAYAIVLRLAVARFGARAPIVYVALLADLLVTPASFVFFGHFGNDAIRAQNAIFATYICGPALATTVFINALRDSRAASVVSAIVAPLAYVACMRALTPFHPAQFAVAVLISFAGVASFTAATRVRRNLDRFARLSLLRRYLQPAAVERVMREDPGAATAVGGKLVDVTVLSTDLRGFTALSEKLGPAEVLEQLNAYHAVMIDVIERHGGAIDKFIGDGTLVVFGIRLREDGDAREAAEAAVGCARAMLVALEVHNAERARRGLEPLKMGIGVHTGPVIAGNIGVPGRRLEFTVIGDAVNTAARLEGMTKTLGTPVLVSSDTANLLASSAGLRELAPISIRGKEATMRVYTLADRTAEAVTPDVS